MNSTAKRDRLGTFATVYLGVALLGAILFETAYLLGYFGSGIGALSVGLYGFTLLIIAVAVGLLGWLYHTQKHPVVLLIWLACSSWFLGIFFYTSYAIILGQVLLYPSVGQVAFQGFHLLLLPVLFFLLEHSEGSFWRPSVLLAAGIALVPVGGAVLLGTELNVVVYNVLYLFVVMLALMLALHLLYAGVFPLFGGGFVLFFLTDIMFISITLAVRDPSIFFLFPLWFSAYAIIAYGAVRYTRQGALP